MSFVATKLRSSLAAVSLIVVACLGFGLGYITKDPDSGNVRIAQASQATLNVDGVEARDIQLVTPNGTDIRWGDLSGKVRVVFFGYTFCPDVCPMGLTNLSGAMDILDKRGIEFLPIFVTVDPKRDTPELLSGYLSSFRDGIMGLSGQEKEIRRLTQVFKAYYERTSDPSEDEYYLIDHTSNFHLIGGDGTLIDYFPESTEAEELAEKIASYL